MKFLKDLFAQQEKHFQKGGKLEKFYPLFEATETFMFTSGKVTKNASHVRDYMDLKRVMMMVVIALIPAIVMALYNTGYQANLAMQQMGLTSVDNWRGPVLEALGIGYDPNNILFNMIHGALYFLPVYIVTLAVGGIFETIFAVVRKHEINEGFLVTSMLFPLILPPDIPLWQVAIGITFGVVIGKEVFGGTGMNILNPALTARAFLFFAYPAAISGDKVWVAVDGLSKATPLAEFADPTISHATASWMDAFMGFIPGSMGETSTLACLIGAVMLIVSGVGSWRIMFSMFLGMVGFSTLLNVVGSATNPMFAMPWYWHLVVGGFAFGTVFMATDPVSASMTEKGKWFYGALIGILAVLIRVINPAFPEGVMLAILFGNVFSPIIDRIFLNANIKRRMLRSAS
ncbi:MAG: NADH:ubiquinone reductase (Na(+)-transporting) subunit B [Calditrichia bacterium]|nr:NADH:ubiquinone reductase (Na(+)-transporting) subunit B [Calditrichota bacterium]MCB9069314.1 NADH:ubiquinone reductase (Na(+)-transporting) subunit B [Calditrichia bacterium]